MSGGTYLAAPERLARQARPLDQGLELGPADLGLAAAAHAAIDAGDDVLLHLEVFDDFFRIPQTEKQSDGMGLGLAIARRLVHDFGGKIWVESDNGTGSKFSFLMPLKPPTGKPNKGNGK